MRNLPCVVSGSIGREKRVPEEGKHVRLGGTWSTEEPEGSPDAQSVVQVEARGKGAEVHRGQITGCLVDPSKEY